MKPEIVEFWRIFDDYVEVFKDPKNLGRERHNLLYRALQHLKSYPESRADFVSCFLSLLHDLGTSGSRASYGWAVIPFCMRELQWPEVKCAIDRELEQINDPEHISYLKRIRSAYEDLWADESSFLYYSERGQKGVKPNY